MTGKAPRRSWTVTSLQASCSCFVPVCLPPASWEVSDRTPHTDFPFRRQRARLKPGRVTGPKATTLRGFRALSQAPSFLIRALRRPESRGSRNVKIIEKNVLKERSSRGMLAQGARRHLRVPKGARPREPSDALHSEIAVIAVHLQRFGPPPCSLGPSPLRTTYDALRYTTNCLKRPYQHYELPRPLLHNTLWTFYSAWKHLTL